MTTYQALINLSVPRKGDNKTDLVPFGGTVELPDDVAQLFLQRQPPVIRRITGGKDPGQLIRPHPKQLFGAQRGIPGPPEGARPDPAGSTTIQVLQDVPEGNPPQVADDVPGLPPPPPQDAVDLPPRGAAKRG